jgi:benzoyl-CoA reductase subunit C
MDYPLPFFHQIWLSFRIDPLGKEFLISELNRLKSHLEQFTGDTISTDAIKKSIHIYNENRSLLKKVYDLRKETPGLIGANKMLQLVTSSMLMPKEEHSQLLTQFLSQVGELKAGAEGKTGLVVVGHPCWAPEGALLNLIEESGGIILEDDLFTGQRYFNAAVKLNGDPIESLADFFMQSMPCPIKHYPGHFLNKERETPDYPDLVIDMFRKSGAKGVIHLGVMYCDPYDLEYPYLKERLEKERIPFLNIRTGLDTTPLEPIRTRLAAFLEML